MEFDFSFFILSSFQPYVVVRLFSFGKRFLGPQKRFTKLFFPIFLVNFVVEIVNNFLLFREIWGKISRKFWLHFGENLDLRKFLEHILSFKKNVNTRKGIFEKFRREYWEEFQRTFLENLDEINLDYFSKIMKKFRSTNSSLRNFGKIL